MERFAKIIDTPTTQVLVRIDSVEIEGEEHGCLMLTCMSRGLNVTATAAPIDDSTSNMLERLDAFDEEAALQFVEKIDDITREHFPALEHDA